MLNPKQNKTFYRQWYSDTVGTARRLRVRLQGLKPFLCRVWMFFFFGALTVLQHLHSLVYKMTQSGSFVSVWSLTFQSHGTFCALLWLCFIVFQKKKNQTEKLNRRRTFDKSTPVHDNDTLREKCSCGFLLNIIITITCVSHVAVALFSPITLYLLNSSFLFIARTLIVCREQRIALLDEHSHADVFPIIWPAVILRCCTTGWKLLKRKVLGEEGIFTGIIFSIWGHYWA